MKFPRKTGIALLVCLALAGSAFGYYKYMERSSNPWNAPTVGDVPAPAGFFRTAAEAGSFLEYSRKLPLKEKDAKVLYHRGGEAKMQVLSAAVVDLPTLSNAEQCADVCMHLRAEWLWKRGAYGQIRFTNCSGREMRYAGGASKEAFEAYLRSVYQECNTRSMFNETEVRDVKDVEAGDVFTAYAGQLWWTTGGLGHAVIIVDVAKDKKGRTAVLLAEGNTPARSIHILRNPNPLRNPWYVLGNGSRGFLYGMYRAENLRHW